MTNNTQPVLSYMSTDCSAHPDDHVALLNPELYDVPNLNELQDIFEGECFSYARTFTFKNTTFRVVRGLFPGVELKYDFRNGG